MAASKLVIISLFVCIVLTSVRADDDTSSIDEVDEVAVGSDGVDSSPFKIELDRLISKIQALELHVEEKTQELKSKDKLIAEKEIIIQDKSNAISSLQSELSSIQTKGSLDAAEEVQKAHSRAGELQKQIDKLKKELAEQKREKATLETRASKAEKKISELNLKLDNLQKINEEQKSKIRKTERALKVAEEEMVKAKLDATSKVKELNEVHGAWLPPWLAFHLVRLRSLMEAHWNEHGKPAINKVIQKATEKKAQAEKWADPHIETLRTKWIPAMKDQWVVVRTQVEPHVLSLKTKTLEVYEVSKSTVTPHVIRVQEVVDPYFQEVKEFSKPYIDQVATVTKPHVEKARLVLKPYTKDIIKVYGKFLKSATAYHHQVQATIQETLKKHELTRPLATKEFEWFAASALLALPIIILFRSLSAILGKKANKPNRHSNTHHPRRKAKRGHPDK
ncbi:hypothetical protein CFOL_v3_07182 [Cephalotus follicularis]|uniref:Uncharacterized protein n=1 Tax=Cephalotus follicularis TaxID=3775 RepID=A0A1Q3B726_CEPFO|nr:hypothetical protein CFOL_v3_07182 [Cephalotus follicularis]